MEKQNCNRVDKELVIVTPVYNTGDYIESFLESVLGQSFYDFDIFLVDDGSVDDSYNKIKESAKVDDRIYLLRKPNAGVSSARNYALDYLERNKKKYKYIYFCDSDDCLGKDALLKVVNCMRRSADLDYAVFSVKYLYKNKITGVPPVQKSCWVMSKSDIVSQYYRRGCRWRKHSTSEGFLNNKVFSFDKIIKFRFDENLKRAEDFDFFIQVHPSLRSGVLVPDAFYYYRKRKTSLTATVRETGDLEVVMKHLHEMDQRSQVEQRSVQHKYVRAIYTGVCNAISNSDYEMVKKLYKIKNAIGIRYRPFLSDIKMITLLSLPFPILKIFVRMRKCQKIGKKPNEYFD